jgi:hypothetical protein
MTSAAPLRSLGRAVALDSGPRGLLVLAGSVAALGVLLLLLALGVLHLVDGAAATAADSSGPRSVVVLGQPDGTTVDR